MSAEDAHFSMAITATIGDPFNRVMKPEQAEYFSKHSCFPVPSVPAKFPMR